MAKGNDPHRLRYTLKFESGKFNPKTDVNQDEGQGLADALLLFSIINYPDGASSTMTHSMDGATGEKLSGIETFKLWVLLAKTLADDTTLDPSRRELASRVFEIVRQAIVGATERLKSEAIGRLIYNDGIDGSVQMEAEEGVATYLHEEWRLATATDGVQGAITDILAYGLAQLDVIVNPELHEEAAAKLRALVERWLDVAGMIPGVRPEEETAKEAARGVIKLAVGIFKPRSLEWSNESPYHVDPDPVDALMSDLLAERKAEAQEMDRKLKEANDGA